MPPHDLLDRAFIVRLASREPPAPQGPPPVTPPPAAPAPAAAAISSPAAGPASVVDRLLEAAPDAWTACAEAVEEAWRTIAPPGPSRSLRLAVIAARPGDGCTTTVEGLAATLRARGHAVATIAIGPGSGAAVSAADESGGESLTLLDAGAWYGAGPIQRERTSSLRDACDAAILLRRAGRPTATACAAALSAVGIEVLGEVVTFAEPSLACTESEP